VWPSGGPLIRGHGLRARQSRASDF
jgi:hypothetical protein